jgi:hypothetical protein
MNEERNLDYSALSERLSAQTQAYVEVANALVKIIETSATTRDLVNETNLNLKEDYRLITEKLQELIINVTVLSGDNSSQHKYIEKDLELLKSKIEENEKISNNFFINFKKSFEIIDKNILELNNYSKKTIDHISTTNEINQENLQSIEKENNKISTDINTIIEGMKNLETSWTRVKYLFWAINILIFIIGLLKSYNIIHFEFIPFKK